MSIVEEARAKVNLALHVIGRRPDGYHELDMLVAFADAGDTVTLTPSDRDRFDIDGPMAGDIQADADNLVLRALRGFRKTTGRTEPLAIRLTKRLPVASGIGGGSADAAATLRGLCRLHDCRSDNPDITALARSLGADVPMCLTGLPAHVTGIGEQIAPTAGRLSFGLLLVNPRVSVSTPAVFKTLERRDNPPLPALPTINTLTDLTAFFIAETRNDLERPAKAIAPAIIDALADIASLPGVRLARMSGSGATCFGLFDDRPAAEAAAAIFAKQHPDWWIQPATSSF